jgi:hypothetical protein
MKVILSVFVLTFAKATDTLPLRHSLSQRRRKDDRHSACADQAPLLVSGLNVTGTEFNRLNFGGDAPFGSSGFFDAEAPIKFMVDGVNMSAGFGYFNAHIYASVGPNVSPTNFTGSVSFICSFSPEELHTAECMRYDATGALAEYPGQKSAAMLTMKFKGVEQSGDRCRARTVSWIRRAFCSTVNCTKPVVGMGRALVSLAKWHEFEV